MLFLCVVSSICFPILTAPFVVMNFFRKGEVIQTSIVLGLLMSVVCMGIVNIGGGDL